MFFNTGCEVRKLARFHVILGQVVKAAVANEIKAFIEDDHALGAKR